MLLRQIAIVDQQFQVGKPVLLPAGRSTELPVGHSKIGSRLETEKRRDPGMRRFN
jgi:hypothetical protein